VVTPAHWTGLPGGAQYQIECLLEALLPLRRHEIFYVARRASCDFRPQGYRLVVLQTGRLARRLGYLADSLLLYRALCAIRPDVIYQRVACGYTGVAAYYAWRHGARFIWHISSDTDVIRHTLRGGSNRVRRALEKCSVEFGIRRADQIVAQSNTQAQLLECNYGRTADAVIHNFHPMPRERLDKTGPVTVVWVANLKPLKQPQVFVRLAQQLRDIDGVHFVMVGAPPARDKQLWFAEFLRSLSATPNLEYRGQQTQEQVNDLLGRSHVLVSTSLHEGFPNIFVQAWMREVPVVSLHSDPDGVLVRESIGVHAKSEEGLAQAVRLLVANHAMRAEYAARARTHAMSRHSMQNALKLVQLIDSAADGSAFHSSLDDVAQ
jgi:glycosyltransferase involved in cell wall biosynthesis